MTLFEKDHQLPISTVGFYHGGDVIYTLEKAPGTWHEQLLDSN